MGIAIIGLNRRIRVANAKATQIFWRRPAEVLGGTTRLLYGSDEQHEAVEQILHPIMNAGGVDEEIQLCRGDGSMFRARVVGRRVSMAEPSLGGVSVIDANVAFGRWIGLDRRALYGKPVYDIAPPDLARTYHGPGISFVIGRSAPEPHRQAPDD